MLISELELRGKGGRRVCRLTGGALDDQKLALAEGPESAHPVGSHFKPPLSLSHIFKPSIHPHEHSFDFLYDIHLSTSIYASNFRPSYHQALEVTWRFVLDS